MATRYAIVAEKEGKKVNLFKDNRTFKTKKYAKYILAKWQLRMEENLFIVPVDQLSDREKLDHAVKVNEALEKKYLISLNCLNGINEDSSVQMGVQNAIFEALTKIDIEAANFANCSSCEGRFLSLHRGDDSCPDCWGYGEDEDE